METLILRLQICRLILKKTMTLTTLLLARGVDIVDGLRAIGTANTICLEALVIGNEIASAVMRAYR